MVVEMTSEFPQHWSNTAPAQPPTMYGDSELAARPITDLNGKIAVITGGATVRLMNITLS
jgi:hypothetical protein